jgi:NAD(P)-dependent dehydrogenase (short-subunit alcohol dehydrogenase family)
MSFDGKQAIVTGAGSGIGAALCRALLSAGATVVCTDIDGDAAERTAAARLVLTPVRRGSTSPTRRRCRPRSTRSSIGQVGWT